MTYTSALAYLRVNVLTAVAGVFLAWSVVAHGAATEVVIQSVTSDLDTRELTIKGTGFDTKLDTTVILGGTQLVILTETETEIVASLPAEIGPGSYLLDVFVTGGTSRSDEFDLSITDDQIIEEQLAVLEQTIQDQQAQIDALTSLLAGVSRGIDSNTGVDTLVLAGANLQLVNATGVTDGMANGAGNLIIGYNGLSSSEKTGSHNLVIGDFHTYTNTSGIIAGSSHIVTGDYAAAVGGRAHIASGRFSFVGGGREAEASGDYAAVAGGSQNSATAGYAFVGGGDANTASGTASFVGGGQVNVASGFVSSIIGGFLNTASGRYAFIGSGWENAVLADYSSTIGGRGNTINGSYSVVAAGSSVTTAASTYCGWVAASLVSPC